MPDITTASISSLLSALRLLPVWMLGGLAMACYAVLFVPAFGGVDPTGFRTQWGVRVWIAALTFSFLAFARGLDAGLTAYRAQRKTLESRRALRLVPLHHQRWWHLAKQQDDTYVSQIRIDIEAANLTDRPVRIVKARLIRPKMKGEILHADVSLPKVGSVYHSRKHAVPSHDTVTAALHIMVRGVLARQGQPARVTLGITDQFDDEYRLKGIVLRTHDPRLSMPPWTTRVVSCLRNLLGLRSVAESESDDARRPRLEWQHAGEFEKVDLILDEEKRSYAACGRSRGGLGSLNVGLQSEPNAGWTTVGSIPPLLWDKAHGKQIESVNASRLIRLHASLDIAAKGNLEQYLLSHLHKGSSYADVGYFIFLALHRLGRTLDAIQAARARLSGDKVYGYSNLLGTLSAIISREHFDTNPGLYSRILEALGGDGEHNFRLIEKINLALSLSQTP